MIIPRVPINNRTRNMREISLLDSADGVWREGASRKYDHTKYEFLAQTLKFVKIIAHNCVT